MMLYIHDKNFNKVKVISKATSAVWLKKAKEEGQCAITIPVTADVLPYIQIDNYISKLDDDMVCQIKKITIKTNEDTNENVFEIIGIDKVAMLSQRITETIKTVENKNVEELIRELINENCINPTNENRKLNITLDSVVGFTDTITTEIEAGTNIFDKIKELCSIYDYCFKLTRNNNGWKFSLYEGNNYSFEQKVNPYIEFSTNFHNLLNTTYSCDKSTFKNMVLSETSKLNDDLKGEDRYEVYAKSSDELKASLVDLVETFSGNVINKMYVYKRDYNIGDIITIRNNLGIKISARIIQINEAYDINGTDITPSFENRKIGG